MCVSLVYATDAHFSLAQRGSVWISHAITAREQKHQD